MSVWISAAFVAVVGLTDSSGLVATEVIRAGAVISPANVSSAEGEGGEAGHLIGREARRTIYSGQRITADNTRPARLVARNQIVTIRYVLGDLEISTTGRAMGEAALHEPVTVMNLQSRQLVQGIVQESGWVLAQ
ncbi:flagellar basal body P-ring formation chaperone FlgA [Hyphomonas sp.]|uniref:flagellar basal body P-ring formation chaperone FlgA n=1 Tax=Hyphomonas sp. TaxID=87 RepID=UPI00391B8F7E